MKITDAQVQKFQNHSPDGAFLQSTHWLAFQENLGRKYFLFESQDTLAHCIAHSLPIVGTYWYMPRGPIMINGCNKAMLFDIVKSAKNNGVGWIRIEPAQQELLQQIQNVFVKKVVKAPHDTQPREIFVIDITKPEHELLANMKQKTRYNIALAQKKGVVVKSCDKNCQENEQFQQAFLKLTQEMALRQGINTHPEEYYRKMIKLLPQDMLKMYVAEYDGKIIAANLVLHYGNFATYLHGASSNENRNVMAPYLLQWQAMLDAKAEGCAYYDFGGVKAGDVDNSWAGITTFKLGFSPETKPLTLPGTYDVIVNPRSYSLYRGLQKAKAFARSIRKH